MKQRAYFYHAGCPVCQTAEKTVAEGLDRDRFEVEVVHLGQQPGRIDEAERNGVKSVPALVIGGEALHINFGAALSDLRG